MLRGVGFKIETVTDTVLYDVLGCIDVQNYRWYVVESETTILDEPRENSLFKRDCYNGEALLKCLERKHFAMFVKLQAYLKGDDFTEINTYEEFKNSNCQIMLLLYDCNFVEAYAKDKNIIDSLYNNASKLNYKDIEFITDENNSRTRMSF